MIQAMGVVFELPTKSTAYTQQLCSPVSPRVVVLRIHFKHLVTKVQFPIPAAQPLYYGSTVVPNLVVFRVVPTEAVQVIELFVQV
jgi:hypothetical protein